MLKCYLIERIVYIYFYLYEILLFFLKNTHFINDTIDYLKLILTLLNIIKNLFLIFFFHKKL